MTTFHARCLCGPRAHVSRRLPAASPVVADAASLGRADPTGTVPIQRRWSRDLDRRWASIKRMLPSLVQVRLDPTNHVHHSFLTGRADPVVAFQSVLDEAMRQIVLGINGAWILPYVRAAADAGALHARTSTQVRDAFDPDQPRDERGRWASVGEYVKSAGSGNAFNLNPKLRGDMDLDETQRRVAKHIDELMRSAEPSKRDEIVYRAAPRGTYERGNWGTAGAHREKAFVSTSGSYDDVAGYSEEEDQVYEIVVPKGTKYVRTAPDETGYTETILPRGSVFTVGGKSKRPGVVRLKYHGPRDVTDAVTPQDRTHLIQALAIAELQGVMEATSQQLVRRFAEGLLRRQSATRISADMRSIVDRVGGQRGRLLVAFMCVRAHAAATLDALRASGVQRVGLVPETVRTPAPLTTDAKSKKGMVGVLTAEDKHVCAVCEEIAMDGPYYIDEAEALIPAHPNCRCAFVPADDEEAEEFAEDAFNPDQPRDERGQWTAGMQRYSRSGKPIEGGPDVRSLIPFEDVQIKGVRAEDFASLPVTKIAISSLTATQEQVNVARVNDMKSRDPVHVVSIAGGKNYLWDGNHRVTRALVDGEKTIAAKVLRRNSLTDSATHIAAGIMIEADSGRVLFVRRAKRHGDHGGEWAFPGGAVEPGETVEQAAARETREEIGYDPGLSAIEFFDRRITNGVDFTTYIHGVELEFRPHLNEEHDAYVWRHLNNAPQPLHPGVAATLGQRQMGDEAWDPAEHPRDKDGKFTHKGGGEAEAALESKFSFTALALAKQGEEGYGYIYKSPDHAEMFELPEGTNVYEVPKEQVEDFKTAAKMAKVSIGELGSINESDSHHAFYIHSLPPAATNVHGKTFGKKGVESSPGTVGESLVTPPPTPVAPPPHALEKHLPSVSGTTAERVLMRSQMKGLKGEELKTLQERHNASLWKQHQNATKQGKGEIAADLASKLDKYSKSYGISNPLKQPKIVPISTASAAASVAAGFKSSYTPEPLPDHPPIDFKDLKKVGEQKGSNPGGVYEDAVGNRYYVKSMSKERADNEKLAAKLYALTGAPTLKYVDVKPDGDTHYVATKFEKLDQDNVSKLSTLQKAQAQQHFATHAWLANWDAAGTGGDNQGAKDGVVKTLDVGGALEFRAKGSPKGEAFGNKVDEFDTLRDPSKNADTAKLFGGMTAEQIQNSTKALANATPSNILAAVQSVHGHTPKATDLAKKLLDRKADLIARAAALTAPQVAPKKSTPDFDTMDDEQQRIFWLKAIDAGHFMQAAEGAMNKKVVKAGGLTVAEVAFIKAFTGPKSGANKYMRGGAMDEKTFAFKHIMNDALDKMPKYDGDTVWRKITVAASSDKKGVYTVENLEHDYKPGNVVHWQAFSSTAKNPNVWSGNVHFTIRKPKSGVDVQSISSNPSEAEVIMPADTYYKVLSYHKKGNLYDIELEEVIPFGKKKKKGPSL